MTYRRTMLLDSAVLLLLTFFLIKPLFRLKYLDNWPSIESTFIAEGRMLSEHLPHPGWQPLWYMGTRTDYIYPPAVPYGTALLSRIPRVIPARAYHLYTAVFYIFGIAAVYWLVRAGSGSRGAAWLASAATALLSPSFLLLRNIRHDSGFWVPQRLHVLMAYGEGPHISSLAVLPAALAVAFLALRKWRPAAFAAAGALVALVVATNFYGATSLAVFYPLMVWAVWTGERNRGVWLRAVGIPVLAYGLCAFWLTPSYLRITLINLHWVSQPGNLLSLIALLTVLALCAFFSLRFATKRPEREWPVFVAMSAAVFSIYVLGFYYFGFRTTGEPARLIPELDLALILVGVEALRAVWKRPRLRLAAVLVTVVAFIPSIRYLRHAWSPFAKAAPIENVYEYKTTKWVYHHLSGQRVLPSGTIRFWYDAWFDNGEPDGGSMQGMLNQNIPAATWQIEYGDQADIAVLWLQALGTDAVIVPDKTSLEAYHDYRVPEKFRGVLPVLYDDGHGTVIYKIPRAPGIARVVDRSRFDRIGKLRSGDDLATLTNYVSVVDDPAQSSATLTWKGFDEAEVEAKTQEGQSLLVEETWDPAWRAFENGKELPIRASSTLDFMVLDPAPGEHRIQMRFLTPLENRIGQVLFFVTALFMVGLVTRTVR